MSGTPRYRERQMDSIQARNVLLAAVLIRNTAMSAMGLRKCSQRSLDRTSWRQLCLLNIITCIHHNNNHNNLHSNRIWRRRNQMVTAKAIEPQLGPWRTLERRRGSRP